MRLGWVVVFHVYVLESRSNAFDVILVSLIVNFWRCLVFFISGFILLFWFRNIFLFFFFRRNRIYRRSFFCFFCFFVLILNSRLFFRLFIFLRLRSFFIIGSFRRTFIILFVFTLKNNVIWMTNNCYFNKTSVPETSPGFPASSSSSVASWRSLGRSSSPSERSSSSLRLRAAIFFIGIRRYCVW